MVKFSLLSCISLEPRKKLAIVLEFVRLNDFNKNILMFLRIKYASKKNKIDDRTGPERLQ